MSSFLPRNQIKTFLPFAILFLPFISLEGKYSPFLLFLVFSAVRDANTVNVKQSTTATQQFATI
jgi:hypothetical protein